MSKQVNSFQPKTGIIVKDPPKQKPDKKESQSDVYHANLKGNPSNEKKLDFSNPIFDEGKDINWEAEIGLSPSKNSPKKMFNHEAHKVADDKGLVVQQDYLIAKSDQYLATKGFKPCIILGIKGNKLNLLAHLDGLQFLKHTIGTKIKLISTIEQIRHAIKTQLGTDKLNTLEPHIWWDKGYGKRGLRFDANYKSVMNTLLEGLGPCKEHPVKDNIPETTVGFSKGKPFIFKKK